MADSAKSFWTMIGILITSGVAWMAGCRKFFKWLDRRKE